MSELTASNVRELNAELALVMGFQFPLAVESDKLGDITFSSHANGIKMTAGKKWIKEVKKEMDSLPVPVYVTNYKALRMCLGLVGNFPNIGQYIDTKNKGSSVTKLQFLSLCQEHDWGWRREKCAAMFWLGFVAEQRLKELSGRRPLDLLPIWHIWYSGALSNPSVYENELRFKKRFEKRLIL